MAQVTDTRTGKQGKATSQEQGQAPAAAPAAKATEKAPAPRATAGAEWKTVIVTKDTPNPVGNQNRQMPVDIAYDVAKIYGHAILRIDGKDDREYVRCPDGVVRAGTNAQAQAALKAHASVAAGVQKAADRAGATGGTTKKGGSKAA
jgi:hypothetical protein